MENKHIAAIVVVSGVALVVAAHWFFKRQNSTPQAIASDVQSPAMMGATSIPAYTPTGAAYQPMPVGAIVPGSNNHATQTPPGISESSVTLAAQLPPKTLADAGEDLHAQLSNIFASAPYHDTSDPTVSAVSGLTGNAALIDSRYVALFGRHAEQAGLDYWTNTMNNGIVTASDLDAHLTRGAQSVDRANEVIVNPDATIKYLR